MKNYFTIFALGMMALSTAAFAGTTATNSNTVSPTLQISATVQSAVQLTLSTGTAAVTHCAVTPTGGTPDYTMNFGTVDALGINAGNCNKFAPATPVPNTPSHIAPATAQTKTLFIIYVPPGSPDIDCL